MIAPNATTNTRPERIRDGPLSDRLPGDPLDLLVDHMRRHPRMDGGAFLLVDPERTSIRAAASWFASPLLGNAMTAVLDRPYERETPGFTEATLERARPLFMPRVEDWEAAGSLRVLLGRPGAELGEELWTAYARASVIACPVRTSLGRLVGVLEVASFDPGRPLLQQDLATAEAMADLAALAHERSTWLAQETTRAQMELKLKRAAADVSGSLETPEVLRNVIEHARFAVSADRVLVSRLSPSGALQRVAASPDAPAGLDIVSNPETAADVPAFDAGQIGDVARASAAVVNAGPDPSVHMPIALGPRLLGVLSVARSGDRDFGDDDVELLGRLARSSAASLLNATLFEQERRVARTLTRGFVPDSLPTVDGYEVSALYEPAEGQLAGGDVYGVWERPNGSLALLIGDVAGKGAGAAGLSAMTRFFVEARGWDGGGPAEILAQAGEMLADRLPEDTFVTAFLAILDDGDLRCANAGHLPPVLMRGDGRIQPIAARGLPLGVDPGGRYAEVALSLRPGDLFYAYTDGLTEARQGAHMLGLENLLGFLMDERRGPGDVSRFVETVHERVRSWAGGLSDDCTSLAVRRL